MLEKKHNRLESDSGEGITLWGNTEMLLQVLINLTADKEQKQAYKEDEYIAGFIESQQQNLMGMGRVLVRVSGTEPKIKTYFTTKGKDLAEAEAKKEELAAAVKPLLA